MHHPQTGSRTLFRITASLLLCFVSLLLTSCESNQVIVNGLEEKEANEIIVFLAGRGISATKVKGADTGPGGGGVILYDITVNEDRAVEAMAILNMNGLPRRRGQNLLGIFQKGGLVPSEMEEKIRYQAGLAEQLASTIRKIDGVLDADIQLSFPEEDPLNPGKKTGEVTASVYVKHQGVLDDPNTHLVTKIKRLVASSIIGLAYDQVTVISDRARFSDVEIRQAEGLNPEERDYVRVWSIIIGKESLPRFRIMFFSLIVSVIALGLAIIWLLWKLLPALRTGGFSQLFSLAPISATAPSGKGKKKEEDEEKPEEGEEEEEDEEEEEEEEGTQNGKEVT